MPVVTIVVADDHQFVRLGLSNFLSREAGCKVIGEASDGLEAVQAVRNLAPDVLVLDLVMPKLDGLAVIRELKRAAPRPRIVVLSMHTNEAYITHALESGADGYVVKDSLADEIVDAIRTVITGRQYLSPKIRFVPARSAQGKGKEDWHRGRSSLTLREREILHLIAQGKANKEIADQLGISVRTVEAHRSCIMRKLHINTHASLIRYAVGKSPLP